MRSLNAGSASRAYVARGVSPPARHSVNRPRSLTASVAASTMRLAAVSASAAGSAHTVRLASDAMLKSYPLIEAALALDRLAVACVMGAVWHEGLPEGLAGCGEVGQDAEGLERPSCETAPITHATARRSTASRSEEHTSELQS